MKKWVPFAHCFTGTRDDNLFNRSYYNSSGSSAGEGRGLLSDQDVEIIEIETESYGEGGFGTKIMAFLEDSVVTFFKSESKYTSIDGDDNVSISGDTESSTNSSSGGYQSKHYIPACEYMNDNSSSDSMLSQVKMHEGCCEKCSIMVNAINDTIMKFTFPRKARNKVLQELPEKNFKEIFRLLRENEFMSQYLETYKAAIQKGKVDKSVFML